MDLRGRPLDIGAGSLTNQLAGLTRTVVFPDTNTVGSKLRFASGVNSFTTGSSAATFSFRNGANVVNARKGTMTVAMGFVSGGTNTILQGCENAAGRVSSMQIPEPAMGAILLAPFLILPRRKRVR